MLNFQFHPSYLLPPTSYLLPPTSYLEAAKTALEDAKSAFQGVQVKGAAEKERLEQLVGMLERLAAGEAVNAAPAPAPEETATETARSRASSRMPSA